jgi:hypothetical protein
MRCALPVRPLAARTAPHATARTAMRFGRPHARRCGRGSSAGDCLAQPTAPFDFALQRAACLGASAGYRAMLGCSQRLTEEGNLYVRRRRARVCVCVRARLCVRVMTCAASAWSGPGVYIACRSPAVSNAHGTSRAHTYQDALACAPAHARAHTSRDARTHARTHRRRGRCEGAGGSEGGADLMRTTRELHHTPVWCAHAVGWFVARVYWSPQIVHCSVLHIPRHRR